jgi:hypothetical protein
VIRIADSERKEVREGRKLTESNQDVEGGGGGRHEAHRMRFTHTMSGVT